MRLDSFSARNLLRSMRLPRVVLSLALLPFAASAPLSAQTSPQPTSAARLTLETLSPHALAEAVDVAPVPSSQLVTLTFTLAQTAARTAALDQFLDDLQIPKSTSFRRWITPAEFATTYGATADQLAAANSWAQSVGLTVKTLSPSGTRLTMTGYPAQVEAAFAISLRQYRVANYTYFSTATQPSLPASVAALFTSVDGLDNLPRDAQTYRKGPDATPGTLVNGIPTALNLSTLASFIDEDVTPLLALDATSATGSISKSQVAAYEVLFRQAAAEGITTLLTRGASSMGFPGDLPEVTAVATRNATLDAGAAQQTPLFARPTWQSAPGLPSDALRHGPDLTASSITSFATTLRSIATTLPGGRIGNVNPTLYQLAPLAGLYTQPDDAEAGTWEPATGLGLIDLEKLAKAFPRGTGSSFASLSLSNYAPTYGTPVTFTSNITSGQGGGVPSGTVSFIIGSLTLNAPVVSGVATYTTSTTQLDAGTYAVQANYSGDGTYASAQSPAGQLYISPEASVLSASVSTGAKLGSTYSVNVTDTSGNGIGQPTGNVTLLVQGTQTSLTQALTPGNGATAATTFKVPANTVGTLTLSINCTTSTNFTCFNPYTTTVTVAKGAPGITISYTPNLPVAGQSVTLNATMTGAVSGPTPTGSVTFYDGTTVLNSANVAANGTVTETATVPNTATHTITATYNGDANYNPVSTSGSSVPGGATSTVTALASSATTVTGGQTFTLSIAVTPKTLVNNTPPSGLVQILDNNNVIGTAPALSGGAATYSLSLTTAGPHSLSAYYPGDTNYAASTSPAVVVTATNTPGLATNTLITSSSYMTIYGQIFTLTAAVTPTATNTRIPTGNIVFSVGGTALATVAIDTSGKASYQLTAAQLPAVGSYTYTAAYSGDATFASSSSSTTTQVVVSPAVGTITATDNPGTVGTGASTTVSATVTLPGSVIPPSGSVEVTVPMVAGAVYAGSLITTGINGASVNIAVPAPPGGTYQLQVVCATNPNYSCPSTTVSLTSTAAAKLATSTTLSASSYAIAAGQSVTFTATVTATTASSNTPSGTVTFTSATQGVLGIGTVTAGVATYTSTLLPAGTYTLTADYSGDALYASSAGSAASSLIVGSGSTTRIATTTALSLSPSIPLSGQPTLFTATVTSATTGTAAISGTVLFFNGSTQIGSGTIFGGVATASATVTGTTQASFTAIYSGDTNYLPSTSTPVTLSPTLAPVTVTLTAAGATGLAGSTVTLTAQVSGTVSSGASPTGMVSFYVSGAVPHLLGTASLSPGIGGTASIAQLITPSIPAGSQTIYAVYSGDTNFAPGTSATLGVGYSDYSVSFTPPSITLNQGASGTVTLLVNAGTGFQGTIALGCTPPANTLITCSLSQVSFAGGGTSLLTINTTAGPKAENHVPGFRIVDGLSLAGLLFCLLPVSRRHRLPGLLLILLALATTVQLSGCATSTVGSPVSRGTPLGTVSLKINTAASNGTTSVLHDYSYQVTIIQ